MFAINRGRYYIECNSNIANSQIINSEIDMNGGVITSHGTPINATDVVNKDYLETYVLNELPPIITVALTGTIFTLVTPEQTGVFKIYVKTLVANGPSAQFELSKSSATQQPCISRTLSSSAETTNEKLLVKWDPEDGIYLRKTGANYDGNYRCKLDFI